MCIVLECKHWASRYKYCCPTGWILNYVLNITALHTNIWFRHTYDVIYGRCGVAGDKVRVEINHDNSSI
jgi:hypothetical protein